jgi:hypothetical protein
MECKNLLKKTYPDAMGAVKVWGEGVVTLSGWVL